MQLKKVPASGAKGVYKARTKKVQLKNKSVTFNVLDDTQYKLYKYGISKSNFSGYIKGLMLKDMLTNEGTERG